MKKSPAPHRYRPPSGTDGFALLLLMVVVVAVTGVLLDRALRARVEYRQASNAAADLRVRAAALAGIEHAVARLGRRDAQPTDEPGPVLSFRTALARTSGLRRVEFTRGVFYDVRIHDVSARLNPNYASEEELHSLFLVIGVGFRDADVAAQSVLDWRDPDELHRARGAEWEDFYRHQPLPVRPRNAPFQNSEELRHVRGMEQLFPRAAPFLTTYGGGRVNLNTAPPEVLRALPGMGDEVVSRILLLRSRAYHIRSLSELHSQLSPSALERLQLHTSALLPRVSFDTELVEIESTGSVAGSVTRRTVRALATYVGSAVQVVRTFEE